ncbi:MAG: APC family permease [Bryobacteraceae bacterium]
MTETRPELRRDLGLWDLVLFNIAAVVGIRWLAAAAHTGSSSIVLWVLAAVFFFVPSALAVSRLTARFPEEGGIYAWTRHGFGDWHGFLCGWCYWLSNLFYFPNLLLAGTGMAIYAFGARYAWLAETRAFVLPVTLAVLWFALLTNLIGVKTGKWTEDLGGAATYLAGAALIAAGLAVWLLHGAASPMHFAPAWNWERVNFWSQIAFAFGGLELGAIMGGEIRDPGRTVPRAAWIGGGAVAAFYILGTLAILALLPSGSVNVLTGLTQAGAAAGARLGIPWLAPALAVLVSVGIAGQLGAWISAARRHPDAGDRLHRISDRHAMGRRGTRRLPASRGHDGHHVLHSLSVPVRDGVESGLTGQRRIRVGRDRGRNRILLRAARWRRTGLAVRGETRRRLSAARSGR